MSSNNNVNNVNSVNVTPPTPPSTATTTTTTAAPATTVPAVDTDSAAATTTNKKPTTTPSPLLSTHLTHAEIEALRQKCMAAKENAYCPYSSFRVGAAVLTRSSSTNADTSSTSSSNSNSTNKIYTGANVENAAYPAGICAERVAVGTAVAAGVRRGEILAVAVASDLPGSGKNEDGSMPLKPSFPSSSSPSQAAAASSSPSSSFCSPCGMCRQFLAEFCMAPMPVIMFGADGSRIWMRMGELLPMSFDHNVLELGQR